MRENCIIFKVIVSRKIEKEYTVLSFITSIFFLTLIYVWFYLWKRQITVKHVCLCVSGKCYWIAVKRDFKHVLWKHLRFNDSNLFCYFLKKKCWYQQKRVILAKQNVQSRFSFWNSIIVSTSLQRFKSLVVFVLKLKLDKKCIQNTVKHPRWLSKHSTGIPENKDSGFWRTHTGPRTFEDPGSLRIQELEDPGP